MANTKFINSLPGVTPIGKELKGMAAAADLGFCPFCKKPVVDDFRDETSRDEFRISGLCQKCQDSFFGV